MIGSMRVIICSLLLAAFALDCSAQTLADIALQERERQKRLHSTVVVENGATTTTTPPVVTPVEHLYVGNDNAGAQVFQFTEHLGENRRPVAGFRLTEEACTGIPRRIWRPSNQRQSGEKGRRIQTGRPRAPAR